MMLLGWFLIQFRKMTKTGLSDDLTWSEILQKEAKGVERLWRHEDYNDLDRTGDSDRYSPDLLNLNW